MSHAPPKRMKGIVCPICTVCTRFRQVSIYRPLPGRKIVYARCANPKCKARVKLKITLEYAKPDLS